MRALAAFALVALLWSWQALAGEEATTWRAGDVIWYAGGCHDPESMIAVAESASKLDLWAVLVADHKCFGMRRHIAARLLEWIDGPFRDVLFAGSVWRVFDVLGDIEFIWLGDAGGRHPARLEMSL